jgi:F-type H+-transporting ATPase subunit alpha
MKQVAGRLRLDLAQFRALEAFAQLGTELDKASQAQLDRGARVVEILKQLQYQPMAADKQVISIWFVTNGLIDDIPAADAKRFEEGLHAWLDANHPEIAQHIRDEGTFPSELEEKLRAAVEEFKRDFVPSVAAVPKEEEAEGLTEEEQERLRRYRRPTEEEFREKVGPAGEGAAGTP